MIEIGMDQHKHFTLAVSLDPSTGEIVDERRLEHDDEPSIVSFLRSFSEPIRVTAETTGNWYWLADLVEDAGAAFQLCHTVEAKRRRRGKAKNDRLDALGLAQLSAEERVPEAYVPPRAERDRRERHRYRIRLIRLRTQMKNAIHALLGKHNVRVPFTDAFGKSGRAFLDALELREPYGSHLRGALTILDALDKQIPGEEAAIRKELEKDPRAELLLTAPGIGFLTAYLILHEAGPMDRYPSDKQFASYCSLAPQTAESAGRRGRPGVGRAGNLYLKEAFTTAALGAIRKDASLRDFYNRQLRRNGSQKARVATARKLAVAVYHMLTRRQPYRPAPPRKHRAGKPVSCLGR